MARSENHLDTIPFLVCGDLITDGADLNPNGFIPSDVRALLHTIRDTLHEMRVKVPVSSTSQ